MGLRAKDIVLSYSAAKSLEELQTSSDPSSASIVRRIRALKPILLADCLHGEVVKGDRIPKALRDRHGLENLFWKTCPRSGGSSTRSCAIGANGTSLSSKSWITGPTIEIGRAHV